MIKVGDVYEDKYAIYTVIRETPYKFLIKRVNTPEHPCSPNVEFPPCYFWKRSEVVRSLEKSTPKEKHQTK